MRTLITTEITDILTVVAKRIFPCEHIPAIKWGGLAITNLLLYKE